MFNPLKMQEMLSKASQMQEEVQRRLAQTILNGSSGGGAVTATINGKKQLLKVRIDPAAVTSLGSNQADLEMLQDLIVAAVNDAGRKAEEALQGQLKGLPGGLNLPDLG